MRIVASIEGRIWEEEPGLFFTRAPHAQLEYWRDILDEGTEVHIVARLNNSALVGAASIDSRIHVYPIRDFTRGKGKFRSLWAAFVCLNGLIGPSDCIVYVRLPGLMGFLLGMIAVARRRRLITHLVGDPEDAAPTSSSGVRADAVRLLFIRVSRLLIRRSAESFYVDELMVGTYPPGSPERSHRKRNVELRRLNWASSPRSEFRKEPILMTAGTQEQPYKGHDLLITAASELKRLGYPVHVRIAGDGRLQPELRRLAESLEPRPSVEFLGHVAGVEQLQLEMKSADIFVLPSRTEGFPRVLVEAMALGLPCVATDVGAISTILPNWLLATHADVDPLLAQLTRLLKDHDLLSRAAADCFNAGLNFREAQETEDRQFVAAMTGQPLGRNLL